MVKLSTKTLYSILSLFLFFVITATASRRVIVGGKNPVENVESNKEVQALGRYCVQEYNRQMWREKPLVFLKVVKADTQVVAGFRYYLKISAATYVPRLGGYYDRRGRAAMAKTFDAVVLEELLTNSTHLEHFAPSQSKFP